MKKESDLSQRILYSLFLLLILIIIWYGRIGETLYCHQASRTTKYKKMMPLIKLLILDYHMVDTVQRDCVVAWNVIRNGRRRF